MPAILLDVNINRCSSPAIGAMQAILDEIEEVADTSEDDDFVQMPMRVDLDRGELLVHFTILSSGSAFTRMQSFQPFQ